MKHYNIPVFITELACPNRCIYCNQGYISGQREPVAVEEVVEIIERHLASFSGPYDAQLAFFGGSFTGIDISLQEEYLQAVQPYILTGKISGIRLSTRPDYISKDILEMLERYNVKAIELGAQSLCDEVLRFCRRGHSEQDVKTASRLIKSFGFELGLQMMIGLPFDNRERAVETANKIVALGADTTRIYPTLVIEHTRLAELYRCGDYVPLSLDEAVNIASELYRIFTAHSVKVLRVGLHPSEGLINGKELLAGPFHVSFRELVLSRIWKERLLSLPKGCRRIIINPKDANYVVGYKSCNREMLKSHGQDVELVQDVLQARDTFRALE